MPERAPRSLIPEDAEQRELEARPYTLVEVGVGNEPFFFNADRKIKKGEHYIGLDVLPEQIEASTEQEKQNTGFLSIRNDPKLKEKVKGKFNLMHASGERLPLADESADEVVFTNVFSAPGNYFSYHKRPFSYDLLKQWATEYAPYANETTPHIQERLNTQQEWMRLIKKPYSKLGKIEKRLINITFDLFEGNRAEAIAKQQFLTESARVLKDNGKLVVIEQSGTAEIAIPWMGVASEQSNFEHVDTLRPGDDLKQYVKPSFPHDRYPPQTRIYLFSRRGRK